MDDLCGIRCKHPREYWNTLTGRVDEKCFIHKKCCTCKGEGGVLVDCEGCSGSGTMRSYIDTPQMNPIIIGEKYEKDGNYTIRCYDCKGKKTKHMTCYACRSDTPGMHDIFDNGTDLICEKCLRKVAIPKAKKFHQNDHRQGMFVQCTKCRVHYNKNEPGFKKKKCKSCRGDGCCIS